ncbi:hypothetical protein Efla_005130 [Eimeria flavescens]
MFGVLTPLVSASHQAASRLLQSSIRASFLGHRVGPLNATCSRLFSSKASDHLMNAGASPPRTCASQGGDACQAGEGFSPTEHPSFDLLSTHYVSEYDLRVVEYRHRSSGARLTSLTAPKTECEKAFMVAFRTPVEDSTGTPHILEHSVLMGSNKYPVKEPFVSLMKSSLYTYMNALTYPDRTCYPVASVNLKDFYNLVSVYMDAVFQPNALQDHLILRQEGWRYELTPKDLNTEAIDASADAEAQIEAYARQAAQCLENPFDCEFKIQGVVLNEMKGVYSSPDSLHSRLRQRALFPDMPHYNLDSGGDPKAIPSLTYDQFKEFYHKRYYPGNARIYFWGADDVKTRLNFVADYLEKLPPREGADTTIGYQKHLPAPRYVVEPYPASKKKMEDYVSVNWVLDAVKDGQEPVVLAPADRMALQLLSHLLVGTSASPLYKALTESGLGKSMIGGGVGLDLRHATFSAGLKGVAQKPEMVEAVEEIVLKCLRTLADEGFSQDAIAASLNTMEFSLRELNTGTFPKGLAIILDMATESNYDRDAVGSLMFEDAMKNVRERLARGEPLFQNLIKKYLLGNSHRVTIKLTADPEMEARETAQQAQMLSGIQRALTPDIVESILSDQVALKQRQLLDDPEEAVKTLPVLTLEDVQETDSEIPYSVTALDGVPLITHELPSSSIAYCDVFLSAADLELKDMEILRLFTRMLTEAGTSDLTAVELQHLIGRTTGGLAASTDIRSISAKPRSVSDPYGSIGFVVLSGKAVKERTADLFCLMHKVLKDANLSAKSRAVEILKESLAAMESSIQGAGHRIGAKRIIAAHTATGLVGELTAGISFRKAVVDLLEEAKTNWPAIEERLKRIRARLLQRENMMINITGDPAVIAAATEGEAGEALRNLVAAIPVGEDATVSAAEAAAEGSLVKAAFRSRGFDREPLWVKEIREGQLLLSNVRDAFLIPTKVNFVCQGGRYAQPGTPVRGQDFVVAATIATHHLWKKVREVGGAYGSGFAFDATGVFCFTSYRDPQLLNTLAAYRETPRFLKQWAASMTQEEVTRAILAVLRDLDAPLPSDQKGIKSFWQLIARQTPEDRSKLRREANSQHDPSGLRRIRGDARAGDGVS